MKRYAILALALVLGCTVFTGCRRQNGTGETMVPGTSRPTEATVIPTTPPATAPATQPPATRPSYPPQEDTTGGVTDGTQENNTDPTTGSRARRPGAR